MVLSDSKREAVFMFKVGDIGIQQLLAEEGVPLCGMGYNERLSTSKLRQVTICLSEAILAT